MKIVEIVASAGRTFNHPYESYSNFKQNISLKATLDDNDGLDHSVRSLQATVEDFAEKLKEKTLKSLDKLKSLEDAKRQIEYEIDNFKNPNDMPF